jgi:hypothetical protein
MMDGSTSVLFLHTHPRFPTYRLFYTEHALYDPVKHDVFISFQKNIYEPVTLT